MFLYKYTIHTYNNSRYFYSIFYFPFFLSSFLIQIQKIWCHFWATTFVIYKSSCIINHTIIIEYLTPGDENKKNFFPKTFFDKQFLDMVGPCPFLGCSKSFREKREKMLMVRNALNEISKFSIMVTKIFGQISLFFVFFRNFRNFCTIFVRFGLFFVRFFWKWTTYNHTFTPGRLDKKTEKKWKNAHAKNFCTLARYSEQQSN